MFQLNVALNKQYCFFLSNKKLGFFLKRIYLVFKYILYTRENNNSEEEKKKVYSRRAKIAFGLEQISSKEIRHSTEQTLNSLCLYLSLKLNLKSHQGDRSPSLFLSH